MSPREKAVACSSDKALAARASQMQSPLFMKEWRDRESPQAKEDRRHESTGKSSLEDAHKAYHHALEMTHALKRIQRGYWGCLLSHTIVICLLPDPIRLLAACGFLLMAKYLRKIEKHFLLSDPGEPTTDEAFPEDESPDEEPLEPLVLSEPDKGEDDHEWREAFCFQECCEGWKRFGYALVPQLFIPLISQCTHVAAAMRQSKPLLWVGLAMLGVCAFTLLMLFKRRPRRSDGRQTKLMRFPFERAVYSVTALWLLPHLYTLPAATQLTKL